jgi:uncharacterized protein
MIIDEINNRNKKAIMDRDANSRAILGVIKNRYLLLQVEKRTKNEEVTDAEMVAIIQKAIKELEEEIENYKKVNNENEVSNVTKQMELIKEFLPKMLSEAEIKDLIAKLDDKSIPSVMKYFKANYAGKCDMGTVQKVLKSM